MFGIGITELMIIGVVLLIAVGPTRLPQLLKTVVGTYRDLRRATRELRANTGIDEILNDQDLKDLRKPLHIPPAKKPGGAVAANRGATRARLSADELSRECPADGVDLAEIRIAENPPDENEIARVRAEKERQAADAEAIRQRKLKAAAAPPLTDEEHDKIVAEKIAAAEAVGIDEDEDRIVAAKTAVAEELEEEEELDDEEHQRRIAEKIAAAGLEEEDELDDGEHQRRIAEKIAAAEAEREPTDGDVIAAKVAAANKQPSSEESESETASDG